LSESEVWEKEVKTATVSADPPKVMLESPTIVAAIVTMAVCQLGGALGRRALLAVEAGLAAVLLLVAFVGRAFDGGGNVLVG
jgi:hypothetical protein